MQMKLFVLDSNTCNYLTVCKQMNSGSFEINLDFKVFIYKSYTEASKTKGQNFKT